MTEKTLLEKVEEKNRENVPFDSGYRAPPRDFETECEPGHKERFKALLGAAVGKPRRGG